ncbi:MAG: protein translocase subunit SecF [Betaproteobacteria bacterium]|nr:protein translocase subunit SecF [Betaproteobacteria bacterium]
MEFFRIKKSIPFMRHALVFNAISFITFLLAVVFLSTKGLNFSIEFLGGTVIEAPFKQEADVVKIREELEKRGFSQVSVQNFGSARDVLIRLPLKLAVGANQNELMEQQKGTVIDALIPLGLDYDREKIKTDPTANRLRSDFVGGQFGKELATDGAAALFFVCIGIMLYLWIRFEWRFALATIIANLHDVIIILGFFAFFQWEFSQAVLAGVLAILGYSVNESVVVFDRARENFRKMRKATTAEIFDAAITGTISRTIITHSLTQMMVLSMLIFGGQSLHYFALALTIGICFGIYSSVLVACPIAKYLGVSREDFVKGDKKKAVEGEVIPAGQ